MHWQRALHIFWQDSNNEHKASCSIACFLFHFSAPIFSLYLLFCCLSQTVLPGLKYCKQSWIRLLDKKNKIYWFQANVSPLNASFLIDFCVLITALSAKHIAIQVRTKCLWKHIEAGNGQRTNTKTMLVFTWKTGLYMLERTFIGLHVLFQARYYVPKSNSEWMTLWGSVFVLSQWLPDQMYMIYQSKDYFLAARAVNSIWDQKIKHCSFWAGWKVHNKMPNTSKAQVAAFLVDLASMVLFSFRTAKMLFSSMSRLDSGTTLKLENKNVGE